MVETYLVCAGWKIAELKRGHRVAEKPRRVSLAGTYYEIEMNFG
jgi:hypothetical protein